MAYHCRLFNTKFGQYIYEKYMICKHKFQVLLYITSNSIKHQSFVYTQLNDQTVLFLTI